MKPEIRVDPDLIEKARECATTMLQDGKKESFFMCGSGRVDVSTEKDFLISSTYLDFAGTKVYVGYKKSSAKN